MPESKSLSFASPRIRKYVLFGLTALLLCALGAGIYMASGQQRSGELVLEAAGDAPSGFVPVYVDGATAPAQPLEPGWDVRRLLDSRSSEAGVPYMGQEMVDAEPLLDQEGEPLSLEAVDQAAILDAAREQAAIKANAEAKRDRMARLQKRLDKVRERHDTMQVEGEPLKGEQQLAEADGAPVQEAGANVDDGSVQKGVIASGETVSQLLDDYLSPAEVEALAQSCKEVYPLTGIRAGHAYAVTLWEGDFKRFEYEIDREKKLVVHKTEDGFKVGEHKLEFDTYTVRLDGEISLSLFGSIERIGESGELAMRLADIFGWEIDFIRDIRVGDGFRVVVEKRMRNGKFMGYGDILAAEFVNQGVGYKGFLFHDESGLPGYYDPEGNSLRKAFLKAPLDFTRISSDFSWKRLHPILKKYRPHPGIDYAAPVGTPVRTVGNGTVIAKGWMGGGGKTVKIRHMNGYETTYMHLSRYARVNKGEKVEQGEIIAYVGSTGLSTGPHLDFRMKKNGNYINPRKVENPKAASLPKHMMPAFTARAHKLNALLDDESFTPVRDFALDNYMPDVAAR